MEEEKTQYSMKETQDAKELLQDVLWTKIAQFEEEYGCRVSGGSFVTESDGEGGKQIKEVKLTVSL